MIDNPFSTLPTTGPSLVLYAMGCLSFILALSSYRKSRSLKHLPNNLKVGIFSKTFNAYDPFMGIRQVYGGPITLILLVSYLAYIGIAVVMAGILESGILLSLVVLGLSVSLMMLGEAFEMFHNANVFTKAVRNNISFGKGDFDVLSILKSVLPKLSVYYLLLAVGFFACGATLSYTMPQALLLFAQLFGVSLEVASRGIGLVAPWFIVFALVFVALLAQIAFSGLKNRFFGFLPSTSLDSIGKQFEMMKQFVHWHHHELAHRAPPEPEQMPDSERERP